MGRARVLGTSWGRRSMKVKTILLGAVAAVALTGTANAGQLPGWYVGIEGGANWIDDVNAKGVTASHSIIGSGDISFDTGWAVLATVGYSFHNHFRLEGEVGYRHNKISGGPAISGSGPSPSHSGTATGEMNELSLMANVLYDIPLGSRATFSIGAGAGGDHANLKSDSGGLDANHWSLAYQGLA